MIVSTIGELIRDLKKYPKSAHKEVVGMVWYRKKFFEGDVENKKFLTDEVFRDALESVNDEQADERMAEQIISRLEELEQEAKEEA